MRKKVLDKAKNIILEKQFYAQKHTEENKMKALENDRFKSVYQQYVSLIIDNARQGLDETEQTKSLKNEYQSILKELKIGSITPDYFCKKCDDTGFVEGKYCDCLIEEINNILKEESGFLTLEDFDKTTFELSSNPEFSKALYEKMKKWCHSEFAKTVIFLSGQTGVGKTHLMKCMANELIKRHKLVTLTSSFAMHQDFLKCYSTKDLEEKQMILDKYLTAEVLFIDDLGTELRQPNLTVNMLYQVLNERKMKRMPTVITSNLTLEDVLDYYDERIASRIADKETSVCVYIQGDDIRLKTNK